MPANNWSICPKCKAKIDAEKARMRAKAEASYGNVSSKKYEAMVQKASLEIPLEETLREDYEIGMSKNAEVFISYFASCERCDFEYKFKHEEKVSLG